MTAVDIAALICAGGGCVLASVRWLRVAQREHYLPGAVTLFALRWWRSTVPNVVAAGVGLAGAGISITTAGAAIAAGAVAAVAPFGLGLKGRTSRLAWTRRLRTVAIAAGLVEAAIGAAGAGLAGLRGTAAALALAAMGVPVVLDGVLFALRPVEDRLAGKYVGQARSKLDAVKPLVVAVTGSYGKTSTKGYIAHILSPHRDVVASPASYNNRAGLARTVNEHLRPSAEILIAEMGTYGPGEIASLCRWMPPSVAVITAIGPAHLERFKNLDRTLSAKAEITEQASVVVLNVDDGRLASLADALTAAGKKVVRASGRDPRADVAIVDARDGLELRLAGRRVGIAATGTERPGALSNVACAAAVAVELGIQPESVLARLVDLPVPPNRLQRYGAERGYMVLDDTFNSNPQGARMALAKLSCEPGGGKRVLVTPGMVELGNTQFEENAAFGAEASAVCSDVVIVARTNRRALSTGIGRGPSPAEVHVFDRLDQAVEWVKENLAAGDAVLYENDLPDHFP